MAQGGKTDGRFKPILANYACEIAEDPKEVSGYVNRANFLIGLGEMDVDAGHRDVALARLQPLIDAGGEAESGLITMKADLLARAGDRQAALAALDEVIAAKPGLPQLLNSRCRIKGELNAALDTALKDCTRAIELTDSAASILDRRALVCFRFGRIEEALADIDSALDRVPDMTSTLCLRGVIRTRQDKTTMAADDLAAVKMMDPLLIGERRRFGIVP